jgi:hypothetical protein
MPVLQNEKARCALPFAAGFPLVAYLRYYWGDRIFVTNQGQSLFDQSGTGRNACPTFLGARPRSPLRLRAPKVSAAARATDPGIANP